MTFDEFIKHAERCIKALTELREIVTSEQGTYAHSQPAALKRRVKRLRNKAAESLGEINHVLDEHSRRTVNFGMDGEVDMFRKALTVDDICGAGIIEDAIAELKLVVPRIRQLCHNNPRASVGVAASLTASSAHPVFGELKVPPNSAQCFVLMPFQPTLEPVYRDHIVKVVRELGMDCRRADDVFSPTVIVRDIWHFINAAAVLIADLTGRNPNVFYEVGLAHAIGKPVVLTTQNEDDVPFDLRHLRYIRYQFTPRGMTIFERDLMRALRSLSGSEGRAEPN